jgi:hypothetical protein
MNIRIIPNTIIPIPRYNISIEKSDITINPNPIKVQMKDIIGFGLMVISDFSMDMLYLGIGIIVLGIILMFIFKIEFDNVIVETRGGKIIAFSVDFETARVEMDHIENAKRDWESSK